MEFLIIASIVAVIFLFNLYRLNQIKKKVSQFNDDWSPEQITQEYQQEFTERLEKARIREDIS